MIEKIKKYWIQLLVTGIVTTLLTIGGYYCSDVFSDICETPADTTQADSVAVDTSIYPRP